MKIFYFGNKTTNKANTRKGVMFALDAMIALFLFTVVLVITMSQNYNPSSMDDFHLRSFSMDMLSSFEKSGLFASSFSNRSELRYALNSLPPNICAEIIITNSSNAPVLDIQKAQCENIGQMRYIAYRTFYANNELYFVRSQIWPK